MKRFAGLLLLAALVCALALPAAADVAYTPRDSFIEKHFQECTHVNRWFWTNGAAGYVLAHKTPESREATPLPNGGKYYISSVWQDKWGVLEYAPDTQENMQTNGSVSGWVDMDEMVPDYDNRSFMADHAAELRQEQAALEPGDGQYVYLYKYPGSGEVTQQLETRWIGDDELLLQPLFTDPAGRTWGYCNYYYGMRDVWVCLDDPHNDALPPDENCVTVVTRVAAEPTPAPTEAPAPTETPVQTETPAHTGKTVELTPPADDDTMKQAAKDNRGSGPYVAAGAGGVVVIAAAVLIAALRKKRK